MEIKEESVPATVPRNTTSFMTGSGYENKLTELVSNDAETEMLRPQPAALARGNDRYPGATARTEESDVQESELTAEGPTLILKTDVSNSTSVAVTLIGSDPEVTRTLQRPIAVRNDNSLSILAVSRATYSPCDRQRISGTTFRPRVGGIRKENVEVCDWPPFAKQPKQLLCIK